MFSQLVTIALPYWSGLEAVLLGSASLPVGSARVPRPPHAFPANGAEERGRVWVEGWGAHKYL